MKNLITSIIASTTPTVTLTISGKAFTGIPCTAYLPSIGETESDRRDMVVIDANENRAAEETAITMITEYVDEDDELIWDGLNTTTYSEDYGTAIAGGSYLFPHEPHTEDDRR